jgi:hypothetical protein
VFAKLPSDHLWVSLRHVLAHAAITLLAVGIAFALPDLARYILYSWWPMVQDDSQMLLLTEIGFAGLLVLLFNLAKLTWHYRSRAHMSRVASLVHVRDSGDWLSRLLGRDLIRAVPWKRDVAILSITGHGTFAASDAPLNHVLRECYEIRVMLLNPYSTAAAAYVGAHADPAAALDRFRSELQASIACLKRLRAEGKQVDLKLHDDAPFWKLVFTGEHAWVRCCHDGRSFEQNPEYVFELQAGKPHHGFFPAFYTYFLNQWNDPQHPECNLDSDELIYRGDDGREIRREPFPPPQSAREAEAPDRTSGGGLLPVTSA